MQAIQYYPFNLSAGQSQTLLAAGKNFRIQSATGALNVYIDNVGLLPSLLTGQGMNDVEFSRLVIQDASGAANSGNILVSPSQFVDNRTYGVQTITGGTIDLTATTQAALKNPLASTGNYKSTTLIAANTPDVVFTPASNVNGAILLSADLQTFSTGSSQGVLIAKNAAPASIIDGEVFLATKFQQFVSATGVWMGATLPAPQFIAAGLGLYYIASGGETSGTIHRAARYRLL